MHRRIGAVVVITAILTAGCTANQATDAMAPGNGAPPGEGPPQISLNLTACGGSAARVDTPSQLTQATVPPKYRPVEQFRGLAMVFVQALACEKVAVDGVDEGPAHISLTFVMVQRDAEHGTAPGWLSAFLLEARTNHPMVQARLGALGLGVRNGTVSTSVDRFPIGQEAVVGRVFQEGLRIYEYQVYPSIGITTTEYRIRFFFRPDAAAGHFDMAYASTESTNFGIGKVEAGSGTALGRFYGGVGPAHAIGIRIQSLTGILAGNKTLP